ncbi:hypothetical protein BDP55DRAFT_639426 [Colletotrichum godetiae]|uniref:Uncharacterized protein n=1 Tax=Colletotrichum godetiae TaxID=1209918 RepID=A0AAJ0A7V7_9PEZI|nr:uncharacterized protein BDP55DRAFT_639426 [Colletotrichum godetiae]KAK1656681.1 hypothetical protein BDP55DRAFT_639426 [Colletotrichum godetiae]
MFREPGSGASSCSVPSYLSRSAGAPRARKGEVGNAQPDLALTRCLTGQGMVSVHLSAKRGLQVLVDDGQKLGPVGGAQGKERIDIGYLDKLRLVRDQERKVVKRRWKERSGRGPGPGVAPEHRKLQCGLGSPVRVPLVTSATPVESLTHFYMCRSTRGNDAKTRGAG